MLIWSIVIAIQIAILLYLGWQAFNTHVPEAAAGYALVTFAVAVVFIICDVIGGLIQLLVRHAG